MHSFFPCVFLFRLSLKCKTWANLCLSFLRNYKTYNFESLYKHLVSLVALCKRESASSSYHSLYLSMFFFVYYKNLPPISHLLLSESLQIFIHPDNGEVHCMLCKRKPKCWYLFLLLISPMQYQGKLATMKLVQHTSDSCGRGYMSFAHSLLYFIIYSKQRQLCQSFLIIHQNRGSHVSHFFHNIFKTATIMTSHSSLYFQNSDNHSFSSQYIIKIAAPMGVISHYIFRIAAIMPVISHYICNRFKHGNNIFPNRGSNPVRWAKAYTLPRRY